MKLSPSKDFLYSLSTLSYDNIEPDVAFSLCLLVIRYSSHRRWEIQGSWDTGKILDEINVKKYMIWESEI
jgi:hypothetical protein